MLEAFMTLKKILWTFLCLALLTLGSVSGALAAGTYFYYDLGVLSGGTFSAPNGSQAINSYGTVTGYADISSGDTRAFSISFPYTSMTNLGMLTGYNRAWGNAINNSGVVVGAVDSGDNTQTQAFLYNGTWNGLGYVSGATNSAAFGINSSGTAVKVVGDSGTSSWGHAFMYDVNTSTMTDLHPTSGYTASSARAVNNSGTVVGSLDAGAGIRASYYNGTWNDLGTTTNSLAMGINAGGNMVGFMEDGSGNNNAFLYNGTLNNLNGLIPGATGSVAFGINTAGLVVGYSDVYAAFLYDGSTMIDLNAAVSNLPLGTTLSDAFAINDAGWIVGNASNGHAYLLTPEVPLPGSLLLLGSGLLGLALLGRRARGK
jgi:probable HAF family extracellular repeat protein